MKEVVIEIRVRQNSNIPEIVEVDLFRNGENRNHMSWDVSENKRFLSLACKFFGATVSATLRENISK